MRTKWAAGVLCGVFACGEGAPKSSVEDGREIQGVTGAELEPVLPSSNPTAAEDAGTTPVAPAPTPPAISDAGTPTNQPDAGTGTPPPAPTPAPVDAGSPEETPDAGTPDADFFSPCEEGELEPAQRGLESWLGACYTWATNGSGDSKPATDWCLCASSWMVSSLSCSQFLAGGSADPGIVLACGERPTVTP